jgi:hypothetical protein
VSAIDKTIFSPSSAPAHNSLSTFSLQLQPFSLQLLSRSSDPNNRPPAKMRSVAFLLPALVAASPVAQVVGNDGWADAPDPNDIQIMSATFSGNGCPQGSVSTNISPDKTVSLGPESLRRAAGY